LWALLLVPALAAAQSDSHPSLRSGHLSLSGGVVWAGGYAMGDSLAEYRSNAPGSTPPSRTLFRAESSIDATASVEARVAYAITPSIAVEMGAGFSRPGISADLSGDEEAAAVTLDAERLSQVVLDGAVVWQLPMSPIGSRVRPFVSGGVGYVRQLYGERTMVETGTAYAVGGGARWWLRGGNGRSRSLGLRGEARAVWRTGGVDFENKTRIAPTVSLTAFWEL
jgi:hypothetical protein